MRIISLVLVVVIMTTAFAGCGSEVTRPTPVTVKTDLQDVNFTTTPLGSTDAAAMQQGGIKSVAFTSMDPAPARYYHTRLDKVNMLEMKTIEDVFKIVLETVFLFDEQGLKETY